MRVAVVGAGIMGSASAFHLSRLGVEAYVFEAAPRSADGVTSHAFGWINMINGDPSSEESYRLRLRAVAEYGSVLSAMPEIAAGVRRGSLVWKATQEQTVLTASLHEKDPSLVLISGEEIAIREPSLLKVPPVGLYSPDDIAVSPSALADGFRWRAEQNGATFHLNTGVVQLWCEGGTVKGLQTKTGYLNFDGVILAAGAATDTLLRSTGFTLGVQTSPVVLLRYQSSQQFLFNVLSCPALEIRQSLDGSILAVEEFHPECEEGNFAGLRNCVEEAMTENLRLPNDITFQSATVGQRPMLPAGLPGKALANVIHGLHILVGHPGVILAPLLAREAAEQISSTAA